MRGPGRPKDEWPWPRSAATHTMNMQAMHMAEIELMLMDSVWKVLCAEENNTCTHDDLGSAVERHEGVLGHLAPLVQVGAT